VVDDVDRIVDAADSAGLTGSAEPHGAGDQHGALRQQSCVICASASGSRVRKNGKADSGQIKCVRRARRAIADRSAIGQRDIAIHDFLLGGVIETHVLLQVRLHDAQMHAVDHFASACGPAERAPKPPSPASTRRPSTSGSHGRRVSARSSVSVAGSRRRRRR
jgi:hypothetical protein